MTGSMKKQISKVAALSASLDELEEKLEPLLSKPLPDTLNSLDTLQQAKLQVVLPYLINDLVFIYLKTRGIDPKTHPVVAELDRVRQYFGKIKDAEESNKKRTTGIDKAAAGRFIKHAISEARQSIAADEPAASEAGPSNSQRSTFVPVRVTEKMREREEYLQRLAEESESDEPVLDVIDDATEERNLGPLVKKGKGAMREEAPAAQEIRASADSLEMLPESQKKKKRKRPMDPFGSLGEEASPREESSDKSKKSKNKKIAAVINNDATTDSRASLDTDSAKKKSGSKKKTKKTKEGLVAKSAT